MVALNAEGFSAMFCQGFLEGYKERKGIELVKGMYNAGLYRDFYGFNFLVGFEVHGLVEGFVEV